MLPIPGTKDLVTLAALAPDHVELSKLAVFHLQLLRNPGFRIQPGEDDQCTKTKAEHHGKDLSYTYGMRNDEYRSHNGGLTTRYAVQVY